MVTKPVVKQQVSDASIITQLKALGFSDELVETPRRLVVSSGGREKTGKSSFALTAPGPIIYLDIDIGTEGVVGKFQKEGKEVLIYHVRVPKEEKKEYYVPMWESFKARIEKSYSLRHGTVVWDTATEAYELGRLARFGKLSEIPPQLYTQVNNEFRELLRIAYDSPMNTVFIHKMRPVWLRSTDNSGKTRSTKTDQFELSGFADMDYLAQVNILHYREQTDEGTVFSVYIKDCRHNPTIAGQVMRGLPLQEGEIRAGDPLCNFDLLLSMVHGD